MNERLCLKVGSTIVFEVPSPDSHIPVELTARVANAMAGDSGFVVCLEVQSADWGPGPIGPLEGRRLWFAPVSGASGPTSHLEYLATPNYRDNTFVFNQTDDYRPEPDETVMNGFDDVLLALEGVRIPYFDVFK